MGDGVDLDAVAPRGSFGFDERADWRITAFEGNGGGSRFWLRVPSAPPVRVELGCLGVTDSPERRRGHRSARRRRRQPGRRRLRAAQLRAGRRFERRGSVAGAEIVDDYAHHPTEVAAAIDAARAQSPAGSSSASSHISTRAPRRWRAGFGEALAGADEAVVTEIYAAREQPVAGVTAKLVVDALAERRPGMPLAYGPLSRRPTTSAHAYARETWC